MEDTAVTSSIGVHIDRASGRLLVANSDLTATSDTSLTGQAMLGAYDLSSGERLYMADMGALVDGRHFANDVTSGPDGTAYVTDSFSPVIYEVSMSEPISADGIVFRSPTELAVVGTTFRGEEPITEVLLLSTDGGWSSASVAGRRPRTRAPNSRAKPSTAFQSVNSWSRLHPVEQHELVGMGTQIDLLLQVALADPSGGGLGPNELHLGRGGSGRGIRHRTVFAR